MAWPVYPHGFLGPGLDEDPYRVERSLRFDGTSSLSRTFGPPNSSGSQFFVLSMWVKVSSFGTARHLFGVGTNHFLGFNATDNLTITFAGTSVLTTTAVFRDPSAWYHIVWRSNNATGSGQFLYVNNQLVGQGTGATNVNTLFNTAVAHRIGCSNTTTPANFFVGYMAEIRFGDEESLALPNIFAEADPITGRWRPKQLIYPTDTFFLADNNGFYLPFTDKIITENRVLHSQTIGSTGWNPVNVSVSANSIVAPDNTTTASSLTSTGSDGYTTSTATATLTSGENYTASVWIKADVAVGGIGFYAVQGVSPFTVYGSVALAPTPNWQRISLNFTPTSNSSVIFQIGGGNTLSTGENIHLWGAQINDGLSAKPYFATTTSAITNAVAIGTDRSVGDTNSAVKNWTANNFSITAGSGNDSLVDSPSDCNGNSDSGLGEQVRGNYCTLNPIDRLTTATLSNGALDFTTATTGHNAIGTFAMTTGKWYWEARTTAGTTQARATVHSLTAPSNYYAFAANTTDYGFRFDADAGSLDYTTDGVNWVSLATGLTSGPYFPFFNNNGTTSKTISANFGQRPFTYTAPSGYKVLCTTNLPTPTIRAPDSEMDVLAYAGDGTSKFLNASNFDVGMSWIKNRTTTSNHILTDVLRPNLFPIIKTDQSKFAEGSSGYFNGVDGNYLDMPIPTDFFDNDFTIEAWVRVPNKTSMTIINSSPHERFLVSLNYSNNGAISFIFGNGTSWTTGVFAAGTIPFNTWFHVAVVKNGNTIVIYQDGQDQGALSSGAYPSPVSTPTARIGAITWSGGFNNETFSGHINGLRLVKTAIYTGNFTPPALSLTATSHSVATTTSTPALLLNMNGADNSTTFTDSSTNNTTITAFGNAKLGTAIKKFGSGSGYFDGNGDRLIVPSDPSLNFGTGDFTVEAWIYITGGFQRGIFGGPSGGISFVVQASGTLLADQANVGGTPIVGVTVLSQNTWHHVAVSRQSGFGRLFLNGNLEVGATWNANLTTTQPYQVGDVDSGWPFNGYIDDLRVTKGVARYTSPFTPPTSELPTPPSDPNGNSVSLLLRMNGDKNSTIFTDDSYNNFTISPVGNVKISAIEKKFGDNSGYFDGTNSYLSLTSTSSFDFLNTDYTIEMWVYSAASQSGGGLISTRISAVYSPWELQINSSNKLGLLIQNGASSWYMPSGAAPIVGSTTIQQNTWTHIAWVRNGASNTTVYINGVAEPGLTNLNIPILSGFSNPSNIYIGGGGDGYFNGYIDDLRVTKRALYIGNFTPPTQQLTTSIVIPTTRILNMIGSDGSRNFIESSQAGVTVTPKPDAASLALSTNLISAEASTTSYIGAYPNTNKVFVTSDATLNANTNNYVNWRWKGGTQGGVTNTSGTITSQVSESEFGGLSIVTYTGTGANATIGHGLGATPAMILVKQRNSSVNGGAVYHRSVATPAGNFLRLFDTTSTNAATADNTVWNGASPTFNSTVFSVGTSVRTNASTGLYVAYCFSEVSGYSRFGSYVGNANANGPFVWCGFRPKWVLIKSSTAADAWLIYDYQRSLVNVAALNLVPNTTAADATISGIDFVANGFKLRTVTTTPNAAQTYVFAAFAESPFKYARAR